MRGAVALVVAAALFSGIAGYLYYFDWAAPLLEGSHIDRLAYGPRTAHIRELEVHNREDEPLLFRRLLEAVNEARPTERAQSLDGEGIILVFFREDGLQYHVFQDEGDFVGLSEGNRAFQVTLLAPELSALLEEAAGDAEGAAP